MVLTLVLDVLYWTDHHCRTRAKTLQQLPIFVTLNHLVDHYLTLTYFVFRVCLQVVLSLIDNYDNRVTSHAWQNQVLQVRSHDLRLLPVLALKHKKYVRCTHFNDLLVTVKPQNLLMAFIVRVLRCSQSWAIVSALSQKITLLLCTYLFRQEPIWLCPRHMIKKWAQNLSGNKVQQGNPRSVV